MVNIEDGTVGTKWTFDWCDSSIGVGAHNAAPNYFFFVINYILASFYHHQAMINSNLGVLVFLR